jgi:hypothetical protein
MNATVKFSTTPTLGVEAFIPTTEAEVRLQAIF